MAKFQRARKPEEKEVRKKAILRAALALAREVGPIDLSLNEVGRRSGVSKPNIYRYFESREEILLRIFASELEELVAGVEGELADEPGDVAAIAECVARAYLARPLLCQLLGMVASILEHNLSTQTIVDAKLGMTSTLARAGAALRGALPWLPLQDAMWASSAIALCVAGLWPASHPSPAAAEALRRPDLCHFSLDMERELTRFIGVLLRGLAAGRADENAAETKPKRRGARRG